MNTKRYSSDILTKIPIFHADTTSLNNAIADHLKHTDILNLPENVDIIKTGVAKRMPPEDKDWYYKRAASIFRSVVLNTMSESEKGVGTHYFARKYKSRNNRGVRPSRMSKGSTGHVKAILEDLVKNGWCVKAEIGYDASSEGLNIMKEFVEK
ncbi:Protein component of the small (40S) ribosomal subunit, partial [Conglomerata obtusa]